ncbi:MAG TPA: metal ABC transporter substrate-binding protein [Acidimicrobiales bacterium]|nr:metal ABC transporter substrate-binding protein [Acidimicrobiales bacterium]
MRRHPLLAAAAAAGLLATACGDGGTAGGGGAGTPVVAATTTVMGDVVAQLTGDLAEVVVIMPANADPHEFQPSAREAAALRDADLVVANGGGFEEGLEDALRSAEDDGATVFEAVDHVALLEPGEGGGSDDHADEESDDGDDHADEQGDGDDGDDHADDDGDDHGHDGADPHVFTDPARMAAVAEALADVLADQVPALDTDAFRDRAAAYVDELRDLDAEVEGILAAVPAERRKLVTNHDVFAYFADRYDFEVVGAVIPSTTTQAAASAAQIDDLARLVASEGVPAVFADTSSADDLAATLAAEVGDVAVVELFSESLGAEGSGADTYAGMMRTNATRIAEALAP